MAPAFMALTLIDTSPWPVMKTIGMPCNALLRVFWRSSPVTPGIRTSSTTQQGPIDGSGQEVLGGCERLDFVTGRPDEPDKTLPHGGIVIDNEDQRHRGPGHAVAFSTGSVN